MDQVSFSEYEPQEKLLKDMQIADKIAVLHELLSICLYALRCRFCKV